MALHERTEFAKLCGVDKSYITVYIGRKKLTLTGKLIDDSLPDNAFFLQKQLDKNGGKTTKDLPTKPPKQLSKEVAAEAQEEKEKGVSKESSAMYGLTIDKKQLEVKKLESDIETARMKREKMAGVLIPTDLVMTIFASHFKSVTISFHQAADNFLSNIAKQNDLDREQVAKIRGELSEVINDAVKDAISASKKDIKKIVAEYSQSKGKGEKE